jgi:hypothetical protein
MSAKKAVKSKKSAKSRVTKKSAKKVAKKGVINPFPGGPRWPRGVMKRPK